MEIRSARVMYQKLKSRIGPKKGKEGVVIYEKGFGLEGGSCRWSVSDRASGG